jgi:TPR repeat protein
MSHDIAKASEPKTAAIVPSTTGTSQHPEAFAIARGDEAMARGDIISARRFYELAAAKGLAGAATAMGRTFDPAVLQGLGVRGLRADVEAARQWYRKAADDGDKEAIVRLQQLPRTANMPTEKE